VQAVLIHDQSRYLTVCYAYSMIMAGATSADRSRDEHARTGDGGVPTHSHAWWSGRECREPE
jgi:hypothetical protein